MGHETNKIDNAVYLVFEKKNKKNMHSFREIQ